MSRKTKTIEIHPGMPVIPVAMVPKSRNVYVVTHCDWRRGEATCHALAVPKRAEGAGSFTTPFKNLIPLSYFGVAIAANTRLNIFAALPNRELANRTREIIGKTISWTPDKASQNASETQNADRAVLVLIKPEYFMRADENV